MVHLPAVEGSNLMTGGVIWVSLGHLKVGELSPPSLLVSHEYCISLCVHEYMHGHVCVCVVAYIA